MRRQERGGKLQISAEKIHRRVVVIPAYRQSQICICISVCGRWRRRRASKLIFESFAVETGISRLSPLGMVFSRLLHPQVVGVLTQGKVD